MNSTNSSNNAPFANPNNNNNQHNNYNANCIPSNALQPQMIFNQNQIANNLNSASVTTPLAANMRIPSSNVQTSNHSAKVLQDFNNKNPSTTPISQSMQTMNLKPPRLRNDFWQTQSSNDATLALIDKAIREGLLLPRHHDEIIKYEQMFIDFVKSDEQFYKFAPCGSFSRLLLHRMAEMYVCDHIVDNKSNNTTNADNKSIVIHKTMQTKFSQIHLRLIDVDKLRRYHLSQLTPPELQEWEDKKARYSGGQTNHFMQGSNDVSTAQFEEDEGQSAPVRMLLKKESNKATFVQNNNSLHATVMNNNNNVQNVNNLDMKQEKYDKMKEKLFAQEKKSSEIEGKSEENINCEQKNEAILEQQEGQKIEVKKKRKGWNLVKEKRTRDVDHPALFKQSIARLKALSEANKGKIAKSKLLKASTMQKEFEEKKLQRKRGTADNAINDKKWNTDSVVDGTVKLKKQNGFTGHSLIASSQDQKEKANVIDSVINNSDTTMVSAPVTKQEEYNRNGVALKVPIADSQYVRNQPSNNPFKPGTTVPACNQKLQTEQQQQTQAQTVNVQYMTNQGVSQQQQQAQAQSLLELYQQQNANVVGQAQDLQQKKVICIQTIQQYNQLIHYFQNAGALSAEQQTYLQSLLNNVAIQQQHLQQIQNAEALCAANQSGNDNQTTNKQMILQQIEQHKQLQLQLISVQQVTQNQSVAISQQLNMHTLQYQQGQANGNQNQMYVATLQMQQDQALQQQTNQKLQAIVAQLIQIGNNLQTLQHQLANVNATTQQQQQQQQQTMQYSANPNAQKQQQPNPTVNALILHTGNSAQNVNINIYADGQSGQSHGNRSDRRTNPRNRPQSFQQNQVQNQNAAQMAASDNASANESSETVSNEAEGSTTQSSSEQQTQQKVADNVQDIAMGPRNHRSGGGQQQQEENKKQQANANTNVNVNVQMQNQNQQMQFVAANSNQQSNNRTNNNFNVRQPNNKSNGNQQSQAPNNSNSEWMQGWFHNRDQKTRTDILRLQKTTSTYKNKKIKNFPKRHPPTPPDANQQNNAPPNSQQQQAQAQSTQRYNRQNNQNSNRRRGGHRGGGYHSRGRSHSFGNQSHHNSHSHNNSRGYDSRRNQFSRFNNGNGAAVSNQNESGNQQPINGNNNQQQTAQPNNHRSFNNHNRTRKHRSFNNLNRGGGANNGGHMNRHQNNNRNANAMQQQQQQMNNANNVAKQ